MMECYRQAVALCEWRNKEVKCNKCEFTALERNDAIAHFFDNVHSSAFNSHN